MLIPIPADLSEETLDEHTTPHRSTTARPADPPLQIEELGGWARRLIELLHARALIELRATNLDEITYHLAGMLQAHGTEAQHRSIRRSGSPTRSARCAASTRSSRPAEICTPRCAARASREAAR